jgi:uncharacterized protein (DUF1330 family)
LKLVLHLSDFGWELPTNAFAGGRFVVRGGDIQVLEGEAPAGRTVVLEFPSRHAALDWHDGDEHAEIRKV